MEGCREVEGDGSFDCTWQPKHSLFTDMMGDATRMQCVIPTFEVTFHSNPVPWSLRRNSYALKVGDARYANSVNLEFDDDTLVFQACYLATVPE